MFNWVSSTPLGSKLERNTVVWLGQNMDRCVSKIFEHIIPFLMTTIFAIDIDHSMNYRRDMHMKFVAPRSLLSESVVIIIVMTYWLYISTLIF